jgi:diguanylate cyclase (GGDEF)-like protein/PAS domain S-box-containing protein
MVRDDAHHFQALVQHATDMIVVIDGNGMISYESPAIERILGWKPDQRLGTPALDTVHPDFLHRAQGAVAYVLANPDQPRTVELQKQDTSGQWHWVESTFTNLLDKPPVHGIVVNYRVVDERKALEAELTHRALHDPLTGLANRVLLRDRLEGLREDAKHGIPKIALLFIDIDNFKTVNDGFGHAAGDQLLIDIGRRLRTCVRPQDLVVRLGGDEFAMLMEIAESENEAAIVARRVLEVMQVPFEVLGHEAHVRASVGISTSNGEVPDADVMLGEADLAMYHAKAEGKAQFAVFSVEMGELVRYRLKTEAELRAALQEGQIRVLYQPILDLASHEVTGVEALVRWQHPERGWLEPVEFLDVAESSGLIIPIGRQVLEEACRQLRRWREEFKPDLRLCVNLSATQLQARNVIENVMSALGDAGVEADALILEVTEGALVVDPKRMAATLQSLSSLGITVAVDDFGTGYSSLSHLRRFPVDIIKVDRTFIEGLCIAVEDATITRAVLAVAAEFALDVIAEGIETERQEAELRRLGCRHGQGFLYSKPVDPDCVDDILRLGTIVPESVVAAT